jgi:hypothetical protein
MKIFVRENVSEIGHFLFPDAMIYSKASKNNAHYVILRLMFLRYAAPENREGGSPIVVGNLPGLGS